MNAATNMKFCSNKSNAKRALNSIGLAALRAAEKLLVEGEDGRWGFNMDKAEKIQNEADATSADNSTSSPIKPHRPTLQKVSARAVTSVRDGKKVETSSKPKAAKTEQRRPNAPKGYTIEKDREEQNGIRRPSNGTICGKIWATLDRKPDIASKELAAKAEKNGWNMTTVQCQRRAWRMFNGITTK